MKTTTALIAAGLLSASVAAHAQGVQPNGQTKPGPATLPPQINSQQMYQGTGPQIGTMSQTATPARPGAAQPQIGSVALPPLPTNLQNPMAASQASTDIFAIMQLMQKLANEQRGAARESRDAAREAQFAALEGAADKMRQAAAAALAQAQVNGAMAIATGAMTGAATMASGAMSPGSGATAQKNLSAPGKGQTTTMTNTKAQAIAQLQAPTKALTPQEKQQGIASIMGAQQAFSANMAAADADKKKAEVAAMSAQASAQAQQQAQLMQQMQAVIADVQQKLQAIMQAQNSTSQSIMRY